MMRIVLSFLLILETINGYFRGDSLMTTGFDAMEAYCNGFGSHLATITTAAELARAQDKCGYTEYRCAIGLYKDDDDDWKWMDGSTDLGFGFDSNGDAISGGGFWGSGQPNNWGTTPQDCTQLWDYIDYDVNDISCDSSNSQYPICNNGYFRGDTLISGYDSLEAYCNSYGSNLATITTAAEMAAAQDICGHTGYSCAIGIYHDDAADVWKWRDGSTDLGFGFDANGDPISGGGFWWPGEPNGDNEDCAHLYRYQDYYVNDVACDWSGSQYPLCNNATTTPTSNPTSSPTMDGCEVDLATYYNLLEKHQEIVYDKNLVILALVIIICVQMFAFIVYVRSNRHNGPVEYKQVSLDGTTDDEQQPLH